MPDSSNRTGSRMAVLAIVVMIVLVAVYLAVQWLTPKSNVPVAPSANPAMKSGTPVSEPAKPAVPATAKPAPEKLAAQQEEARKKEEFARGLEDGRRAMTEKRYEDAHKYFEKARETGIDPMQADKEIEGARQAIEQARRAQQEMEIQAILTEAQKLMDERRWDELFKLYEEALKNYPGFRDRITAHEKEARAFYRDALTAYRKLLNEARQSLEAGRLNEVRDKIRTAGRFYANGPETGELQAQVKEKIATRNLVRIAESESVVGDDAYEDEKPKRTVRLKTFRIDAYEVTNEEYAWFVEETGRPAPKYWGGKELPKGSEKMPVTYVSHADAEAFAAWAGKRLPTEEEWEKAARFVDGRTYPWGNTFMEIPNKYSCHSFEHVEQGAAPAIPMSVGSFPQGASPYGVYDLAGNVWEWTSTRVETKTGGKTREYGVLKGGSFMTPSSAVRASNRMLEVPEMKLPDVGFRCVKDK